MGALHGADAVSGSEWFQAGDLQVDVGQQSVTRAGEVIALPNLSFKLLLALLRAAPNFVDNEALMRRVWPGLVVSPETVSKRVALLRDALGDDPKQPRYIAGLRSRGYRIVVPVSSHPLESHEAALLPAPTREPPEPHADGAREPGISRTAGRLPIIAATLGAIALLAMMALVISKRRPVDVLPTHVVQVTTADDRARTVAVLPFDNISANPNDAYLAFGVPEILINRLSNVAEVLTIARSSSFAIAAQKLDSAAIGQRLNAGYLIEGSVQRQGERLRIAVELIEAGSGKLVWSDRFDRQLSEILQVEDEIGDHVAATLLGQVEAADAIRAGRERSANVEAYLAFLRGRSLLGRFAVADTEAAIPYLERAIEMDPNFASAYALLYDAKMQAAAARYEDLAPLRRRYQNLIDKALSIDPDSGTAYFARALWGAPGDAAREADFARGAKLDPSNGRGLSAYAEYLENELDRPNDATAVLQRALKIDPMSPRAHYFAAIRSMEVSGFEAVEQKMRQVLELDPNFVPALQRYGKYQWQLHANPAAAIQIEEHAIALDPQNPWLRHTAMAMYLDVGDPDAARDVASGTPQSAAGGRVLLALYRGDWRDAGLAASRGQPAWSYGIFESWGAPEALRDYALKTGSYEPAIAVFCDTFGMSTDPKQTLSLDNFREAVYVSQLLAAQGHGVQADALRHAAAAWNDAHEAKFGSLYARRLRAGILLLDGRRDAALTELAESFRAGDYLQWWYTLRHDALWESLRDDPRFRAIDAEVSRFAAQQRAAVQTLRTQGLIPRRPD
jgi:TolB-like protein/DNA-binding winged helix-turn-helix (wHTH) protein/Tfp pilus assembly protein PilF